MDTLALVILLVSLVFFLQSMISVGLMLYTWEHPERMQASKAPSTFLPARLSFTVLLPARHEEAVIYQTIQRVWRANYPPDLLEIMVICHADDSGTIAEAERAIRATGSQQIHVATFSQPPINKPHGLNVGLQRTANQVVTIFDAEDDIDPDIFNMINTVMLTEGVGIVQAGVQLMNFSDHWFSIHNCMEYFFWFKSRLHFHAKVGMIPLGGNTIFVVLVGLAMLVEVTGVNDAVIYAIGRNPDLTGRASDLWPLLIPMAPNVLLGAGFESFWTGPRMQGLWDKYPTMHVNEAHNGYIETYLNLGLIGVAFILFILVHGYRRSLAAVRADPESGGLMLAYTMTAALYSYTEAGFRMLFYPWSVLILMILGATAISQNYRLASAPAVEAGSREATRCRGPNPSVLLPR